MGGGAAPGQGPREGRFWCSLRPPPHHTPQGATLTILEAINKAQAVYVTVPLEWGTTLPRVTKPEARRQFANPSFQLEDSHEERYGEAVADDWALSRVWKPKYDEVGSPTGMGKYQFVLTVGRG